MSTEADNKYISETKACQPVANRISGVHPQKQKGLFMQRIKILGGRINWRQWHKVAELAAQYSCGSALHITTRQDIELHNIAGEDIPAVQQGVAEVGLAVFAAGGDSVRNITVCSGCQFDPNVADIFPLAQLVRQHLEQHPIISNLPRKFKMSFSGCRLACAKPWLNDLGFIAQRDGLFTVIGAGSLGPKPALGIELYRNLLAKDVLVLCIAALEFFEACGERKNRRKARFRHIRQKLGDRAFRTELDSRFSRLKASQSWPDFVRASGNKNIKLLCCLQLPNGNIFPEEAIGLADVAEPKGAVLRINLEHGLELYGTKAFQLPENLAGYESAPVIIACPGSSTCSRAITNGWSVADEIRRAVGGRHRLETRINISSCQNNCAHSTAAGIGLVGMVRKQDSKRTECYRVFTGGGNGQNDKLAEESEVVLAKNVAAAVGDLLERTGV